jgi:hypothetical protein
MTETTEQTLDLWKLEAHRREATAEEVEAVWEQVWEPILCASGEVNLAQLKRELFDATMLYYRYTKVLAHTTGGKASNPQMLAASVIAVIEEHYEAVRKADNAEQLADLESDLDAVEAELEKMSQRLAEITAMLAP